MRRRAPLRRVAPRADPRGQRGAGSPVGGVERRELFLQVLEQHVEVSDRTCFSRGPGAARRARAAMPPPYTPAWRARSSTDPPGRDAVLVEYSGSVLSRVPGSCLIIDCRCSSSMSRSRRAPGSSPSGGMGTSGRPAATVSIRLAISAGGASPLFPGSQASTDSPRGSRRRQSTPARKGSARRSSPIARGRAERVVLVTTTSRAARPSSCFACSIPAPWRARRADARFGGIHAEHGCSRLATRSSVRSDVEEVERDASMNAERSTCLRCVRGLSPAVSVVSPGAAVARPAALTSGNCSPAPSALTGKCAITSAPVDLASATLTSSVAELFEAASAASSCPPAGFRRPTPKDPILQAAPLRALSAVLQRRVVDRHLHVLPRPRVATGRGSSPASR
jgi:hypothetical protein